MITPGRWCWRQSVSNGVKECLDIWSESDDGQHGRRWVATLPGSTALGLSNPDDAVLIAAAPDLLAACKTALARIDIEASAQTTIVFDTARSAIRAAIEKAERKS